MSMANGQAGPAWDELGARDRRHAPVGGIWATGRRWGRSQARLGPEVWIVSGGQIGLGNENESRTDLYLKTLTRAVTCRGKEKSQRRMEWTWPRE